MEGGLALQCVADMDVVRRARHAAQATGYFQTLSRNIIGAIDSTNKSSVRRCGKPPDAPGEAAIAVSWACSVATPSTSLAAVCVFAPVFATLSSGSRYRSGHCLASTEIDLGRLNSACNVLLTVE